MFYEQQNEINYYKKQQDEINKFIKNNTIVDIDKSELKIGDKIIIYFYACSQKYIYTLYPKYGEVIENKNYPNEEVLLINYIIKNERNTYNAFHEGLGIYSNCFDYKIVKLI